MLPIPIGLKPYILVRPVPGSPHHGTHVPYCHSAGCHERWPRELVPAARVGGSRFIALLPRPQLQGQCVSRVHILVIPTTTGIRCPSGTRCFWTCRRARVRSANSLWHTEQTCTERVSRWRCSQWPIYSRKFPNRVGSSQWDTLQVTPSWNVVRSDSRKSRCSAGGTSRSSSML